MAVILVGLDKAFQFQDGQVVLVHREGNEAEQVGRIRGVGSWRPLDHLLVYLVGLGVVRSVARRFREEKLAIVRKG